MNAGIELRRKGDASCFRDRFRGRRSCFWQLQCFRGLPCRAKEKAAGVAADMAAAADMAVGEVEVAAAHTTATAAATVFSRDMDTATIRIMATATAITRLMEITGPA